MSKRNDGSSVIALFMVIGFLLLIGLIMDASTPKCIKAGCKNDQSPNSSYCYLHKPYTGHSSYKSKSSSSGTSTSTGNKSTSSGSTSSSNKSYGTSKKSSSYSSYDDGYDAVYEDDDYDDDRYWSDPDYADGVDDAMDELDW